MQTLLAYPEVTVDRHVPRHLTLAVTVMVVSAAINLYTDSHIPVAACLAVLFTLPLLRPPVHFPEADCVWGNPGDAGDPHVTQKQQSAIDGRTTCRASYAVSLRLRKRVEEIFGWMKTVGGFAAHPL